MSEEEAKDRSSMMPSAHTVRKSAHIRGLRTSISDGTFDTGVVPTPNESFTIGHLDRPYVRLEARSFTIGGLNRLPYDPKVATKIMIGHGAVV